MYSVGIKRELTAQHHLVGGDFGPEGIPHDHHYVIELSVEGKNLGAHDFLVDITLVESCLDELLGNLEGSDLNEHPMIGKTNPSVERVAEFIARSVAEKLPRDAIDSVYAKLWEKTDAFAAFRASPPA